MASSCLLHLSGIGGQYQKLFLLTDSRLCGNCTDGDFFNFESSSLSKSFRGSTDLDFDNEPPARKKKAVVAEDDDL